MHLFGIGARTARRAFCAFVAMTLGACSHQSGGFTSQSLADTGDNDSYASSDVDLTEADDALARGDLRVAGDAYRSAMRTSKNPEAILGLAETHLAEGDFREADRLFLMADRISYRPEARSHQGQGLIALRRGQNGTSISHLKQAVDQDPALWRAWIGLARAYLRQGDTTASIAALAQAEHHAPNNPSMLNDLGMFHLSQQDAIRARSYFERAQQAGLDHAYIRANLRIATALSGRYEAAISGVAAGALPDALNNAGYAAILNGDLDVADKLLRRAVEISPVYHVAAMANLDLLNQVAATRKVPDLQSAPSATTSPPFVPEPAVSSEPEGAPLARRDAGPPAPNSQIF